MISMTVAAGSGASIVCNPDLCEIDVPGQYSFNANAFLDVAKNQIDVRYQLQSIQPQGTGGIVSIFVQSDQLGQSISSQTVPIGTGRETDTSSSNDTGTFVNITLTVGANQSVGGDWLGTVVPVPPPATPSCTPPLIGVPPNCMQPPPPPCTACVPVTPPAPAVPLPTLGWHSLAATIICVGLIGLFMTRAGLPARR